MGSTAQVAARVPETSRNARSTRFLPMMLAGLLAAPSARSEAPSLLASADLTSLSLEQLMDMEVTSVTKTPERRSQSAAAIYVLTADDIRRSGATSIPEALRLVPGVEVSRINSSQWSIGIRGFATGLSRYTLVLIDGRSVYSPLFAGTYWDAQDTTLEDIDRIEVIRGPGGSLWGSNAVNGVINIITKSSKDTQGMLASAGGGTEERSFGDLRYGGQIGEGGHYRVYGKYFDRGASFSDAGDGFDAWQGGRGGFRSDWDLEDKQTLTVQGDYYLENTGVRKVMPIYTPPFSQAVEDHTGVFGGNVMGRWNRDLGDEASASFQLYYDRTGRQDPSLYQDVDTVDGEFQHTLSPAWAQKWTYGFGYRFISDHTVGLDQPVFQFKPTHKKQALMNVFAQDQIALVRDRLTLTLGAKSERNDYTGWENQPNARLAWTPTERQTVWSAVSRAIRTPSRLDREPDITFAVVPPSPMFPVTSAARYVPNDAYLSEKLMAYELGYRAQPAESLMTSVDGFYNRYDDIQSLNLDLAHFFFETNPFRAVIPFFFENKVRGKIYGGEFNAVWNPLKNWRLEAVYSFARVVLENKGGSTDGVTVPQKEGLTPRHQVSLRSRMDLPGGFELDPTARYVDVLPAEAIPAYWTMDLRLGWRPADSLELSVTGQNLLQPHHPESNENVNEIQRGVYGKATWRWRP